MMVPLVPLAMSASAERLKRIIAFIPIAILIRCQLHRVLFFHSCDEVANIVSEGLVGSGYLIFGGYNVFDFPSHPAMAIETRNVPSLSDGVTCHN
jgi:hypothetical protein